MKKIFGSILPSFLQPLFGGVGFGSLLYDLAQAKPNLDLRFASNRSLTDAITGANLVTFTRASTGTFVGSDGLIQSAVTNLLLRSEELDNASWTKNAVTVTANATMSPLGTATADKLVENTANNQHIVYQSLSGTGRVLSFYAKAAERNWVTIWGSGGGISRVNLTNGTTGTVAPGATITIQFIGDGWYRIGVTETNASFQVIGVAQSDATISYTGDGTSGIYLWGAQLEQASTVGEYIPTTSAINSAPRFDHNPTTGESLGLLVEEDRTNLVLRSEEFDNASWGNSQSTDLTNTAVAPNSTTTADSLIEDSSAGVQHFTQQLVTVAANTLHTASVFVKANTRSAIRFGILNNTLSSGAFAHFNAATGVISTQTTAGTATSVSYSIEPYANGWYRCRVSCVVDALSTTASVFIGLVNGSDNATYTGDGTSGIFLWGAQLELGAFPTSYIKNIDTVLGVTRAADVASITGTNFSSFYNQTEGTVYHQGKTPTAANFFSIDDGTTNNRITSYMVSATEPYLFVSTAGGVANLTSSAITAGSLFAQANAYKINDFAISTNGGTVSTDTTGNIPTVNKMVIGANVAAAAYINGTIKRLVYFSQRLPNSTLQAISQP